MDKPNLKVVEGATCKDCAAVQTIKDPNQIGVTLYVCRRHPPQPLVVGMTQQGPHIAYIFPQVSADTPACGDRMV